MLVDLWEVQWTSLASYALQFGDIMAAHSHKAFLRAAVDNL
jgi:hypothetical protein